MAGEEESTGPLKVFLWTTPRTVSTSFLKCMTYVPDTVAWHEPYLQIAKFSKHVDDPLFSQVYLELVEKHGGAAEVAKINSGFDASDKDFDWLKAQLEGDFPGKKLVFVKDMGASIFRESRQDKVPKGFRHTFLIRNPHKMTRSQLKLFLKSQKPGAFTNPKLKMMPEKMRPVEFLNQMWKWVKAEGLESRPIIIDIDELLENPKDIIEAYCKEVGIPFTEDLLTWPAGDDVMTDRWMVPKETILTFRKVGAHAGTFASTGFQTTAPTTKSIEEEDEALKKVPFLVSQILNGIAEREFPFYEEMHAARLTVNNNK